MPKRLLTATTKFDGHDAGINYAKYLLLQQKDVELIHLAHNRSVEEIVNAVIQEDVGGVCVSSYQGGHMEFFAYLLKQLRNKGSKAKLFIGGGATITLEEAAELRRIGVSGVYRTGDTNFVEDIMQTIESSDTSDTVDDLAERVRQNDHYAIGCRISIAEECYQIEQQGAINSKRTGGKTKVVGITGPGGAGKSTLVDELVRRFTDQYQDKKVAVISVDPTKESSGTLLGDRIRMNYINNDNVFMRSIASRGSHDGLSAAVEDAIEIFKAAGYDMVIVETVGMDQLHSKIREISDLTMNVMTSAYGSQTQLDKKEIIDQADYNIVNKSDRQGSQSAFDALVDMRHMAQMHGRNKGQKVFSTTASRFNDEGVDFLFNHLMADLGFGEKISYKPTYFKVEPIIPHRRVQYLGEAIDAVRAYNRFIQKQVEIARDLYALERVRGIGVEGVADLIGEKRRQLDPLCVELLKSWDALVEQYQRDPRNQLQTLSGLKLHRIELPDTPDLGERLNFLLRENVPGHFPFTNGAYEFRSEKGEEPTRMFAGLQTPDETNKRLKKLSKGRTPRLSIAFDGLTLYGEDPDVSQGDYGKIGESGVSICTLDDMKRLFDGYELSDNRLPDSKGRMSTSMTINGPAPIILAMFFNTAIEQQIEKYKATHDGKDPTVGEIDSIRQEVFRETRGTVQADILKEDIAQNSCIFSLDFALKMMGDVQQFFVDNQMKFRSVSISGYHIAEAGANPIQQLAYTISNGLTYVEYYLSRGMHIDDIARNLSFFFSTGLDDEYTVIGRVARKIWAIVMRDVYGANEKSQKMVYHIQTSGRSLQEREPDLNDIRTTLQALTAWSDSANSLHTNSYNEASTTPTDESVRRALAIQAIIGEEFGYANLENVNSGSYATGKLTDDVEYAVLEELSRLNEEGGVLGAIENGYQRRQIGRSSAQYQYDIHTGKRVIVGVNKYKDPEWQQPESELIRSTDEHKQTQIRNLAAFKERNNEESLAALDRLKSGVRSGHNIFAELLHTTRYCSLGQITHALYEVGGMYRRSK